MSTLREAPEAAEADTGRSPACTAAKEKSCFLNPGTELAARFSAIVSCQRSIALRADAAWWRLTFIRGCLAVAMPVRFCRVLLGILRCPKRRVEKDAVRFIGTTF